MLDANIKVLDWCIPELREAINETRAIESRLKFVEEEYAFLAFEQLEVAKRKISLIIKREKLNKGGK